MVKKIVSLLSLGFLFTGCAILHHIQIGEIDNRSEYNLVPIEFKVSETGIDLNDAKLISKIALSKEDSKNFGKITEIIALFQMGPSTGAHVYSYAYSNHLEETLRIQCPSGHITGISAIRETRKYPVISGEIVKVKAYCMTPRGTT